MNQVEIVNLLNTLSIPSFYDHAPNGTRMPFLTIHITQPDNFAADDAVYIEKWHFRIDLYCAEKSIALEREIKDLLNTNRIGWVRSEQYIDEESCYEVEFDFDEVGDEDLEADDGTP